EKAVSLIEESRWRTLQLADAVLRKDVGSGEFRQRDHELYTRCMDLLRGISITGQRTTRVGHLIRALGEDWAMALVSAVLRERGIRHSTMDARLVVRTGPAHGECRPDLTSTREQVRTLLRPELDRSSRVLIQGYVGADAEGETTTMGSESSNLTAAILGRLLSADSVTVFSNVPGVMTIDPGICADARVVRRLDYASAHRLAVHGVKILYPTMVPLLAEASIPLVMRPLHDADAPGTVVHDVPGSSPLRCIVRHAAVRASVHPHPMHAPEGTAEHVLPTAKDEEMIRIHAASCVIQVRGVRDTDTSDSRDDSVSGLLTVFHEGIAGTDILTAASSFLSAHGHAREGAMGAWTLGPELTCLNIPCALAEPLAIRLHSMLHP
ncbi:MAG: hypothetical protein ACKOBV_00120, partial [Candidatus Kapaibacterium sp.]